MTSTSPLPPGTAWLEASAQAEAWAEAGRFPRVSLDHAYLDRPLGESLAEMVRAQPHDNVIVTSSRTLTYRAFWNLVQRLADTVRSVEVPAGPIALLLRDDAIAAAALFAGLAAARPCLGLDRGNPVDRNAELIRLADAPLVLIEAGDDEARAAAENRTVLAVAPEARAADAPVHWRDSIGQDEPAFIFPTSGSTGRPKLIVHSQRTAAYRANQRGDAAALTRADRMMVCSGPPTGYSGVTFLLAPIRAGAAVHLISMRQEGISGLLRRLDEERISILMAGSSLLRVLLDLPEAARALSHLRLVRIGGEATTHADVAAFRRLLPAGCVLETGYGATEATNLRWPIPSHDTRDPVRVPGGYPEIGGDFLLLDEDGRVCPPGMPGELVVRSAYNALGEWRDGSCEPGRLIPDPACPAKRIYFTGDLARRTDDGVFVIIGRKDRQIKLNGQRVELAEIEVALRATPGVVDAIVLAEPSGQGTALLAFVSAGANVEQLSATGLRRTLRARLPGHMVPARIEVMSELPRLPGGKPDAVRLLAGDRSS